MLIWRPPVCLSGLLIRQINWLGLELIRVDLLSVLINLKGGQVRNVCPINGELRNAYEIVK